MVLRYWGERGLTAESFSHLVERTASGIRTTALVDELKQRGWDATAVKGDDDLMSRELSRGRPVLTLIEDRPGAFHYLVVVAAHQRAVIFHDPARAPFRVMSRSQFARRWSAAGSWMAVVVPGSRTSESGREPAPAVERRPAPSGSCEQLVADGVRQAQAQDLEGAERSLTSALSCPGSAALRELAGVRVLQKRWPDVAELAAAAVAEDAHDEHAWRLLATSRFIQSEPAAALSAWNHVGEPRMDLLRVNGLTRTRPRVVEQTIGLRPGDIVTPSALARGRRRLAEIPSTASSSLEFVPVPSGLAELRANVSERPLVPSDKWSLATMGVMAAAARQIRISSGSPSGGGELLGVEWRFWPGRPRVAVDLRSPAPWGGVWGVGAFAERQPFDSPDLQTAERRQGRLMISNWASSSLRWSARAGIDRWNSIGTFGSVGGDLRFASRDDRFAGQIDLDTWSGDRSFAIGRVVARVASSSERKGLVFLGTIGAGLADGVTPADLWFAGDTGQARPILLRAHPLVDDGRFRAARLGRSVVHGSMEAQRWWRVWIAQIGAGAFLDSARVGRRLETSSRADVDVGSGARLSIPGRSGVLRIDIAKGLRDGSTALSFVYEP